jgi:hypothetical protein
MWDGCLHDTAVLTTLVPPTREWLHCLQRAPGRRVGSSWSLTKLRSLFASRGQNPLNAHSVHFSATFSDLARKKAVDWWIVEERKLRLRNCGVQEEEAPNPEEKNLFMQPPSKPAPPEPAAPPSAQAGAAAAEEEEEAIPRDRTAAGRGQAAAAAASSSAVTNWWSAPLPSVRPPVRIVSIGVREGVPWRAVWAGLAVGNRRVRSSQDLEPGRCKNSTSHSRRTKARESWRVGGS